MKRSFGMRFKLLEMLFRHLPRFHAESVAILAQAILAQVSQPFVGSTLFAGGRARSCSAAIALAASPRLGTVGWVCGLGSLGSLGF
jgi:hypothetical protein